MKTENTKYEYSRAATESLSQFERRIISELRRIADLTEEEAAEMVGSLPADRYISFVRFEVTNNLNPEI